jgi:hypothetical protein
LIIPLRQVLRFLVCIAPPGRGQAEFLRIPQAQYGPVKVPEEAEGMPDERFVYLSDVLPTSWQGSSTPVSPRGAAWWSSG